VLTVAAGRKALQQAALFARFGVPRRVRPDMVDDDGTEVVRVYSVPSREAAEAFVAAERETWGNPARAELRESLGWCVVVDLRAVVAAHRAAHPLPRIRG
jgi:hypothetical protein